MFIVIDKEKEEIASNGDLVKNKSKIQITTGEGNQEEEDTLFELAWVIQTQAGINNQERTILDVQETEGVIEADFITN